MASTRRRGAHAAAAPDASDKPGPANTLGSAGSASAAQSVSPARSAGAAGSASASGSARTVGSRIRGFRARLSPVRVIIAVLVLGFVTIMFAGGLWSSPSAEPTVQQFLLDWQ